MLTKFVDPIATRGAIPFFQFAWGCQHMNFKTTGTSLHRAVSLPPLRIICKLLTPSPSHYPDPRPYIVRRKQDVLVDLEKELAEAYGITEPVYSTEVFERTKVAAL